jgi:hypothetical protein
MKIYGTLEACATNFQHGKGPTEYAVTNRENLEFCYRMNSPKSFN